MSTQWHELLPHKNNARFEKIPSRSAWFEIRRINHHTYAHLGNAQYICPAHNEFCISPAFVGKVQQAIAAVNNHTSQAIPNEEFLAFPFDGFSFYLPKDHKAV